MTEYCKDLRRQNKVMELALQKTKVQNVKIQDFLKQHDPDYETGLAQ